MNLIVDSFKEWFEKVLPNYKVFDSTYPEYLMNRGDDRVAVITTFGVSPQAMVRYIDVQITLLGERNLEKTGSLISLLRKDAETLMEEALKTENRTLPSSLANIRATSDVIGVGLTSSGRPWVSLSFEIIL